MTRSSFPLECYRVMISDFDPGIIRPHAARQHNSTLTAAAFGSCISFSPAFLVCFPFLSSFISCGEAGTACWFWLRWCFGPEHRELPDSRLYATATISPSCYTTFLLSLPPPPLSPSLNPYFH